ncbi:MAG TPA: PIN domain-containing protein [Fimbriiglobus sp.]|jgi:predicted nucleic acid-binding protein|nr:PIN domain-containing protein [Fimbriiglobus sp.]
MRILCDTNLLIRLLNPSDANNALARAAMSQLLRNGDELVLMPQNLYEFWSVATRPADKNGHGLTPTATAAELVKLRAQFTILDDTPAILPEWERLVVAHAVLGKNAHDARLVAAMHVYGVTHLLTFNDGDFRRFTGITVLTPASVAPPGP